MATLNAIIYLIANSLTSGRDQEAGSKTLGGSFALANGEHFQAGSVVADDYQNEVLWNTTEGGLTTFQIGVIKSDKDVLVEIYDGTDTATQKVFAGIAAIIGGYMADGNALVAGDGTPETENAVTRVAVTRNVAVGVGDAYVTLSLFGCVEASAAVRSVSANTLSSRTAAAPLMRRNGRAA